ncbi:hypothetical protein [Bacillus sp. D386]|uniref:hypothetical protein n=1 Tax=Bacillus sp. D386 TaxID=2587155 RepID=UPI0011236BFB|nr:hypothetical protein [Bacillus sp. D386]
MRESSIALGEENPIQLVLRRLYRPDKHKKRRARGDFSYRSGYPYDLEGLGIEAESHHILSKVIMENLTDYLNNHLPRGAYVSLIVDSPADKLYEKFDFEYNAPQSVGMYRN